MRLLLDEHYSPAIARGLRSRGFDVVSVAESPNLQAASDLELFAFAVAERRAVVTEDVADFVRILREHASHGDDHHGIIFTSPRSFPRSRSTIGASISALAALLGAHPADDALLNQTRWLAPG